MALERKSELKNIQLLFDDSGGFLATCTWDMGAWCTVEGAWVSKPDFVCTKLDSNNRDDMKRFNDALGVLTSECVRRTVAAQQRMADMILQDEAVRAQLAEERGDVESLKAALETETRLKDSARERAEGLLNTHLEYRKRIQRLTFGLLGR